jgi:hypothetical protein
LKFESQKAGLGPGERHRAIENPTDDDKAILERIAQMLTRLIKSRRPIE